MNGQIVSEGSVLNSKGILLVDCNKLPVVSVSVWNGNTEWTPQSVSGSIQQYTVSSGGSFTIRTSEGRVLLSFSVIIPQDFTIDSCYTSSSEASRIPGTVVSVGTYMQVDERTKDMRLFRWVKSTGADIMSLDITATNGAVVTREVKEEQYGDDWVRFTVSLTEVPIGRDVSVFIGNVLVLYLAIVKA